MAEVKLICCVLALAIAGCYAVPPVSPYAIIPGPVGHPGPGGYGGQRGSMTLTCAVNFTDPYHPDAGVVNAIAVTIVERQQRGHDGGFSHFLPYGGFSGSGRGLSASIEVFSLQGGKFAIAFTEKARPERGCQAEDFGYFYTGNDRQSRGGKGLFGLGFGNVGLPLSGIGGVFGGNYGYGNYGNYGGYGSYGYGGGYGDVYGGYGGHAGFGVSPIVGIAPVGGHAAGNIYGAASGGYGGRQGDDNDVSAVPGVVATLDLSPGTSSEVNIDSLGGFDRLKDLAGRGVVVCPQRHVEHNFGGASCEGGIISCCALHYDMGEQSITLGHHYYA